MIVLDSGGCAFKLAACAIMQPEGRSDCFDKMLRFDSSRLSVHPVEPRVAGSLPTARPVGHRLSVVLTLAESELAETVDEWPLGRNGFRAQDRRTVVGALKTSTGQHAQ